MKPGDAQLCFRTATGQIEVAAAHTMDPKTKLYYHAWNDALDGAWRGLAPPTRVPPPAGAPTSPVLWSRAIGWYIAGIVDVLEYLPANDPERPALRAILRNLAEGLERFQDRKTGLWYQVIDVMAGPLPATGGYAGERDRPAQPNWLETSASAIFAYSLAKAVRLGELPARYRAVAVKAWNGVKSRIDVDADGTAHIHGTVVGLSVGGTYNAYVNADVRGAVAADDRRAAGARELPDRGAASARDDAADRVQVHLRARRRAAGLRRGAAGVERAGIHELRQCRDSLATRRSKQVNAPLRKRTPPAWR